MADNPQDRPDLRYYAMIQIGLEMAAPVALGAWLDSLSGWFPGLTATGAVLGLVLGLVEVTRVGKGKKKPDKDPEDRPRS